MHVSIHNASHEVIWSGNMDSPPAVGDTLVMLPEEEKPLIVAYRTWKIETTKMHRKRPECLIWTVARKL